MNMSAITTLIFQEPTSTIIDQAVPLASISGHATWSLLNLVLVLISLTAAVIIGALYFYKPKQGSAREGTKTRTIPTKEPVSSKNTDTGLNQNLFWRLVSISIAMVAVVIFLLAEEMTGAMVLVDSWTPFMLLAMILQCLAMLFAVSRGTGSTLVQEAVEINNIKQRVNIRVD